MSDNNKEPDLKDIAATAGKLFHEIKCVVTKMFHELKNKVPSNNANVSKTGTEETPNSTNQSPKTPSSCELPKVDSPTIDTLEKTDSKITKMKTTKDDDEQPK